MLEATRVQKRLRSAIRQALNWIRRTAIRYLSRSGFLSSLYFVFFSRRFDREHKAVLQGILQNLSPTETGQSSSPILRRCIHRLEKGLCMRPRRRIFAEGYILDTVQHYAMACRTKTWDRLEWQWATDVLSTYFDVVGESPIIRQAADLFKCVAQVPTDQSSRLPYPSDRRPHSAITFDQLHTLFQERRSIRWFQQVAVPRELIRKAVTAASLAPSACNRQPFYFLFFDQPEEARNIARLAGGTAGFCDNIPALIVLVGDLSSFVEERDRHLIYIDGALAAMQLMLALQTLGLSSCPINWPDIEQRERNLQQTIGLKDFERPVMFIAVGKADGEGLVPYSQKKSLSLLLPNHC